LVPKVYAPDLVVSRKPKVGVEIHGEKSSVKDTSEMDFYRKNRLTVVTVPNEVARNPEYTKPIFQLLALVRGSDHLELLFSPERG
jgi:hypothetical protein